MRAAAEREFEEYASVAMPRLRRTAYLLAGDDQRADDIVQETVTALYVHWRRARRAEHLDAYVRRMLVNVFLGEKRRAWASRVQLVGEVPDRPAPEHGGREDRESLRVALLAVPPRQRAVLVLRYVQDLPIAEVAELLGCSEGTVKSQAARGLVKLREALGVAGPAARERKAVR